MLAAHELRTPIQPILGLSQILRSMKRDDSEHDEFLDAIIRNAKRLTATYRKYFGRYKNRKPSHATKKRGIQLERSNIKGCRRL